MTEGGGGRGERREEKEEEGSKVVCSWRNQKETRNMKRKKRWK